MLPGPFTTHTPGGLQRIPPCHLLPSAWSQGKGKATGPKDGFTWELWISCLTKSPPGPETCQQEGRCRSNVRWGSEATSWAGRRGSYTKGPSVPWGPGERPAAKKIFLVVFSAGTYIPE